MDSQQHASYKIRLYTGVYKLHILAVPFLRHNIALNIIAGTRIALQVVSAARL